MNAPAAEALVGLLDSYSEPALASAGRLVEVPPPVAARALELLPADLAAARLNLVQPPTTWLVAQAARLPRGRLTGSLTAGRPLVVFDGIQVDAAAARELADRVAADWPAAAGVPGALEAAVAEVWTSLLTGPLPPDAAVVGLWWD